jgi:hypothetical protein
MHLPDISTLGSPRLLAQSDIERGILVPGTRADPVLLRGNALHDITDLDSVQSV